MTTSGDMSTKITPFTKINKENLPTVGPFDEDRAVIALMGIRIFIKETSISGGFLHPPLIVG